MSKHDSHFFNVFGVVLGLLVAFAIGVFAYAHYIGERDQVAHVLTDPRMQQSVEKRVTSPARVAIAGHDNSALTIAATTGGPGTGTVNSGSATYLAFYPAAGTTVDDATLSVTTGAGIAHFNLPMLVSDPCSPSSGDFWLRTSSGTLYLMARSNGITFGVQLVS